MSSTTCNHPSRCDQPTAGPLYSYCLTHLTTPPSEYVPERELEQLKQEARLTSYISKGAVRDVLMGELNDKALRIREAMLVAKSQAAGPEFQEMSTSDIFSLPPAAYLLDPVIPERALVNLAGKAGVGKSFLALSYAYQLAALQKRVLYVALEGIDTQPERIKAWLNTYGYSEATAPPVSFMPEDFSLNTLDPESVQAFCAHLTRRGGADLVIIDNFNETFSGDENSAQDMGQAMSSLKAIKNAAGGTVLVLGNFGHSTTRLRGSSKARDYYDAMLGLTGYNQDGREAGEDEEIVKVRLSCHKMRRGEKFKPVWLESKQVLDSRVFVPAGAAPCPVILTLQKETEPVSAREIAHLGDMKVDAVSRLLTKYRRDGVVTVVGTGRSTKYRLSEAYLNLSTGSQKADGDTK